MSHRQLPAAELTIVTDPEEFSFDSTDELVAGEPCLGQERAVRALRTGLQMRGHGFHILALGYEGVGKQACIDSVIASLGGDRFRPVDRCLLPVRGQPGAYEELELPPGRGDVVRGGCREVIVATLNGATEARRAALEQLAGSVTGNPLFDTFLAWLEELSGLLVEGEHAEYEYTRLWRLLPQLPVRGKPGETATPVDLFPDPATLLGSVQLDPETGLTRVVAGTLLRASGGCLMVDGRRLVENLNHWRSLREVLRTGVIPLGILPVAQSQQGAVVNNLSGNLRLTTKVILLCDPPVLDHLQEIEADLERIFPVIAEFEYRVERSGESLQASARIMAAELRRNECLSCSRGAIARMCDLSMRLAGSQRYLSLYRSGISSLLREASLLAGLRGEQRIEAAHVAAVFHERDQRLAIARRESRQAVLQGEILVEREGERIGQVNALTIVGSGLQAYAETSRVTARVRAGDGHVIDIEREVDLGGSIHSKGVMILTGLLGSRYQRHVPLSLTATLVFEQSYAQLDGDSASVAEMLALLSAITDIPLRQSLAITGALDQRGQVMAVGDVTLKVEGFFDLCREAGIVAGQGVVIPAANRLDLVLRDDVVEAVADGRFTIHVIDTLDDAIELLTGMTPGRETASGRFPRGTFNARVAEAMQRFAEDRKNFDHKDEE